MKAQQQPVELELVPDQQQKATAFFTSQAAYEDFRASFHQQIKPALEKDQEARRLSEEDAKRHLVY